MDSPLINIEVDHDVWEAMKAEAEPLVDTPNTVLRRKFGLGAEERTASASRSWKDPGPPPPAPKHRRRGRYPSSNGKPATRRRAPKGSLLPEGAYELPILEVLHRHGGRAAAREVIEEIEPMIEGKLTPLDREELSTGGLRWQKRVQFTRLRLVERGLIKKDSPRGIWEITDDGIRALTAESTKV